MKPSLARALAVIGLIGTLAILAVVTPEANGPAARTAKVERVVDGDTLLLVGRERVRLIGVDAPEIVHRDRAGERGGEEAKAFADELAAGREVELSFDAEAGFVDRYGRTLAYVTLPDGTLLNLEMIRAGWAEAYRQLPYAKKNEFRRAEREARRQRLGLWAGRQPAAVR
jgi:micrococcal nuclease